MKTGDAREDSSLSANKVGGEGRGEVAVSDKNKTGYFFILIRVYSCLFVV
jgi:hypothetical protein